MLWKRRAVLLVIWFIISVVTSLAWLGYVVLYVYGQLGGNDFSSLAVGQMAAYVGLAVIPIWVVWQIFASFSAYRHMRKTDEKMVKLLEYTKKNQDYTDLIVRVMLDAEHEIKDGFIINKFDVFVADLNELLADILLRSNAASSLQLEQLWKRVKNGERWVIAKSLIEAEKRQSGFSAYLAEKARKDAVFKGTLFEFCARYQDLSALLEKHDRDRTFINMIETGVLGKVYSLLAPVSDEAYVPETPAVETEIAEKDDIPAAILNMPEPEIEATPSFWSKINPFHKETEENLTTAEAENQSDEAFFAALQKNLNEPSPRRDDIELTPPATEDMSSDLRENPAPEPVFEKTPAAAEPDYMPAPDISAAKPVGTSKPAKTEHENFAYPFGGWMNDENYK